MGYLSTVTLWLAGVKSTIVRLLIYFWKYIYSLRDVSPDKEIWKPSALTLINCDLQTAATVEVRNCRPTSQAWELILTNSTPCNTASEASVTCHIRKGFNNLTYSHWNVDVSQPTSFWPSRFSEVVWPKPVWFLPSSIPRWAEKVHLHNAARTKPCSTKKWRVFCVGAVKY